jgi:enoyl-CoA hydratase/carnithine racemase
VKNAITIEMASTLAAHIDDATNDAEVRAIVLTGSGRAFCGGGHLGRLATDRPPIETRRRLDEHMHRVAYSLERCPKPVICAVNGDAFAAGLDMALMCDVRYAAESARFTEAYVLAGLVPGDGGCYFLPRAIGMGRALELLMSGDMIDASEAERIGLVNRVYPDSELFDRAHAFAARLATRPSVVIQTIKRMTYASARSDLRTSLDLAAAQMAVVRSTDESAAAFTAFDESRRRRATERQTQP